MLKRITPPGGTSTAVLIPAFNEENTIGSLIKGIKKCISADIIVIDDVSNDRTSEVALAEGAVVLNHALRAGAWGAMRTGFRYAARKGYTIAVTMDADGQHKPESIHSIIDPVESGKADVVIGSCPFRASPARRFAWAIFRKFSRLDIDDLTSGLKAYNREAIQSLLSVKTSLLDYQDVGVLLHLKNHGFRIFEIPVSMCQRISGKSKIFSSWAAVCQYLILTGIVCLSKAK